MVRSSATRRAFLETLTFGGVATTSGLASLESAPRFCRQRHTHRRLLHLTNWVECIRTRQRPNAPAEAGVSAASGSPSW